MKKGARKKTGRHVHIARSCREAFKQGFAIGAELVKSGTKRSKPKAAAKRKPARKAVKRRVVRKPAMKRVRRAKSGRYVRAGSSAMRVR